jgi:predicted extracellular nuclease
VPEAFVADATSGTSDATEVTAVAATLPSAVDGQPVVQVRILTTNAVGSDEWVGIDDLAISGVAGPGGPAAPIASCPTTLTVVEGGGGSTTVSATDADSEIVDIALASPAGLDAVLMPSGAGQATVVVSPTAFAGTYTLGVTFTADDGAIASCDITVTVAPVSPVSAVQGAGSASPMLDQDVVVEAVVTSLFTRADTLDGFFVQEEDTDADGDPATSEGIFVFCRGTCPALGGGEHVRLIGRVAEFFEMTQVDVTGAGSVEVLSSGSPLPAAVPVDLPAGASTKAPATFESVEGMVVQFPEELTVSEHFELARYGQLRLTSDGRTNQYTHDHAPDRTGYAAFVDALNRRTIILDDDNNDQNDAVTGPQDEAYPYPSGGLDVDDRFRAGDTVTGLTGVLHYSFAGQSGTDAWRVRPIPGEASTFDVRNPAPPDVEAVGGRIQVAAFNVLNYFTTIDETSSSSAGPCGPLATLDCRGADSAAELARQRAKEVVAIGALDADVVGLVELQNDDGTAVRDLVAALNARPDAVPYAELATGPLGTDAIKVAFIYRPSTVVPVGPFDVLTTADDPRFLDTRNRPALSQQFEEVATGERFTASINHFKSKGSACLPDDPDLLDGQGNCSITRTNAAAALADHLAGLVAGGWDPDVLVMGDLNAYRREAPIAMFEAKGYTDLIDQFLGEDAYSYLFDGQLGYLDHALASASLVPQVTGVTEWHVNADEVPLFDYNDAVRDVPGEADFERESTVGDLYAEDARRASDHDPVLVGLDLASLTIDDALVVQAPRGGGSAIVSGTTGRATGACPTLRLTVEETTVALGRTHQLGRTTTCTAITSRGIVSFDRRTGAFAAVVTLPSSFRLRGDEVTFDLHVVDGATTTRSHVERAGQRLGLLWRSS